MASSVGGQRRSPKALPKAKLAPKKWSWSLFGGLLPVWATNFLNPGNTITSEKYAQQIDEMHGKSHRWHWSTERASSPPRQRLAACRTVSASEVEQTGLQSFASSAIFTWPLANRIPVLRASQQLFAGKMAPRPAGGRKCFPRVRQIPKDRFLCYRNKQTFVVGKNKFIVMVPILMNKDVLKLSYNDFKSNHNCFRTNLNISVAKSTS